MTALDREQQHDQDDQANDRPRQRQRQRARYHLAGELAGQQDRKCLQHRGRLPMGQDAGKAARGLFRIIVPSMANASSS